MIISGGTTIIGIGLAAIGIALFERSMYKSGKEYIGYIVNLTTKTILIFGGLAGIGVLLIHAVKTLLGG